jgi:hypothetical protein
MPSLALAYSILAKDNASPVFAKVGSEAKKAGDSVKQAAAEMQRAANAEVDAAAKVRVAQARLNDLRKSGKTTTAAYVSAEEGLAKAERLQVRAQSDAVRAAGQHEHALKKLSDETSRASRAGKAFGGAFAGGIKSGVGIAVGALALLKGVGSVHDFVTSSISEARESQKVGATTTAIIKATGGAAKISADQIGSLSTAISNKTGIDDEAIQSGSNLLLTFKNVRNEAGLGNDVFNRATQSAVDLSKAGFGSISSASKGLGKALNDPVKGISALNKAGVTFTQSQKDQIKALVKSGDVLGAQKIILGEVEHQVGGVAKASTTAGEKLKVAWDNGKESLGTKLLPALDTVERLVIRFGKIGGGALKPFFKALDGGKNSTGSFVDFLDTHQGDIISFFVDSGHAAIGLGKAVARGVSVGLHAYAAFADGVKAVGHTIQSEEARFLDSLAQNLGALGFEDQAAKVRKASQGIRDEMAANDKIDSGKFARDLAGTIDGKLIPALDAADKSDEGWQSGDRQGEAPRRRCFCGAGDPGHRHPCERFADPPEEVLRHLEDVGGEPEGSARPDQGRTGRAAGSGQGVAGRGRQPEEADEDVADRQGPAVRRVQADGPQ